eukprot:tig00020531_g10026.t1
MWKNFRDKLLEVDRGLITHSRTKQQLYIGCVNIDLVNEKLGKAVVQAGADTLVMITSVNAGWAVRPVPFYYAEPGPLIQLGVETLRPTCLEAADSKRSVFWSESLVLEKPLSSEVNSLVIFNPDDEERATGERGAKRPRNQASTKGRARKEAKDKDGSKPRNPKKKAKDDEETDDSTAPPVPA